MGEACRTRSYFFWQCCSLENPKLKVFAIPIFLTPRNSCYLGFAVEDQGTFRVWLSGEGGLLGLRTSNEPIIFFFHGGGQSGLSWTLAVQELKALYRSLYIVAPDFRGHGATKTIGDSLLVP